jgi:hypothetical protein
MARALKAQPLPTPERLTTQPLRAIPRIAPDAATPPAAGTIDISAMARQGAALTTPPPAATGTSVLRIFITLDMPRGSLQRLVDQAARLHRDMAYCLEGQFRMRIAPGKAAVLADSPTAALAAGPPGSSAGPGPSGPS